MLTKSVIYIALCILDGFIGKNKAIKAPSNCPIIPRESKLASYTFLSQNKLKSIGILYN